MRIIKLFFFLLFFISNASAQSIDSFEVATKSVIQYESFLINLFQLKNSGQSDIYFKANSILCIDPGPQSPFPLLYKINKKKECTLNNAADEWLFYPDCKNKDYHKAIAEYLAGDFIHSKSNVKPEFKNICTISNKKGVILIRYESIGELVDKKCSSQWTSRIAIINFSEGDAFISGIRFPINTEINAPCLQSQKHESVEPITDLTTGIHSNDELVSLEDKIKSLNSDADKMKRQLAELEIELKKNKIVLQRSEERISLLLSEIKFKTDSISLYSQRLQEQQKQYNSLLGEYNHLETGYENYKILVTKELDSISRQLTYLDNEINNYGNKVVNTIKAYEKFDIANTSFLSFNYGLVQAPYNPQSKSDRFIDPVKNSFHTEDFTRNFGVAFFRPNIGVFISNLRLNFNKPPDPVYTIFDFDAAKESLFIEGVPFKDLTYIESGHNLNTINFGLTYYLIEILNIKKSQNATSKDTNIYVNENRAPQIPILNSLYFMLGISWVQGEIWHYYDGSYPSNFIRDEETNYYVLDKSWINKTGVTIGITYLKPYFQFELGYNTLYSDFYINIGANIPMTVSNQHLRMHSKSKTPHEDKNIQRMREDVEKIRNNINKANTKLKTIKPTQ